MKKILPFIIFLILSACTEEIQTKIVLEKITKNGQIVFHRTLGEMEQNI